MSITRDQAAKITLLDVLESWALHFTPPEEPIDISGWTQDWRIGAKLTWAVQQPTGGYLLRCPSCGAEPATRCRDLTTGELLDGIHGSRIPDEQEATDGTQREVHQGPEVSRGVRQLTPLEDGAQLEDTVRGMRGADEEQHSGRATNPQRVVTDSVLAAREALARTRSAGRGSELTSADLLGVGDLGFEHAVGVDEEEGEVFVANCVCGWSWGAPANHDEVMANQAAAMHYTETSGQ